MMLNRTSDAMKQALRNWRKALAPHQPELSSDPLSEEFVMHDKNAGWGPTPKPAEVKDGKS